MWSTWGASPWEGKSGAEVGIVNRKVARRARAGQTFPLKQRLSASLFGIKLPQVAWDYGLEA